MKSGTRWLLVAEALVAHEVGGSQSWRGYSSYDGTEGGSGDLPRENFEKIDLKWCVLGYFKHTETNFLDWLKVASCPKKFCQLPSHSASCQIWQLATKKEKLVNMPHKSKSHAHASLCFV